jgi:hypothetical protein
MAQANVLVKIEPLIVWPAVAHCASHGYQPGFIDGLFRV